MEDGHFRQAYHKYSNCFCPLYQTLALSVLEIEANYKEAHNQQVSQKKHKEGAQVPVDLKI
jgi:hypothetical protein